MMQMTPDLAPRKEIKLYPFQEDAVNAVFKEWEEVRSTLLVLPTGTGKTVVFSKIVEQAARRGQRSLILAHRAELIDQAGDKLAFATGLQSEVEKADQYASHDSAVVVGSVQTLMGDKRRSRFAPDHFDIIVVDEAHHALADSYRTTIDYFSGAKLLGVTATPDRGDKRDLGAVFESIAFEYPLHEAVEYGWLARPIVETCPLQIDLSNTRMTAGDYNAGDLGEALAPYAEQIVQEIKRRAPDRKTLIFLPLIATSKAFCELLQKAGFDARHVDGQSEDRDVVAHWLSRPGPKVCCNAMLYTEGFDEPSIDCVIVLRPTKSRPLYAQMIGRGTRRFQGKKNLLILDFLWMTGKHELCRPASLVADKPEIAQQMQIALEAGGQADLLDAQESATEEVKRQRHEALAKALEEQKRKKSRRIDPIAFAFSIDADDLADYEPLMPSERRPPTQKQLDAIERFGINAENVVYHGHASKILDKLIGRSKQGLATAGQIRLLNRFGYEASMMTRTDASAMIEQIKSNGWRRPEFF